MRGGTSAHNVALTEPLFRLDGSEGGRDPFYRIPSSGGVVPPVAQAIASDGSVVFVGGVNLVPGSGILRARGGIMRLDPSSLRADTIAAAWIVDYHSVELPTSPIIASRGTSVSPSRAIAFHQ